MTYSYTVCALALNSNKMNTEISGKVLSTATLHLSLTVLAEDFNSCLLRKKNNYCFYYPSLQCIMSYLVLDIMYFLLWICSIYVVLSTNNEYLSASPAVYLLILTVSTVNNWWSPLAQRVTGPGEMSHPFLYLYSSLSLSSVSVRRRHRCLFFFLFFWSVAINGMKQPDRVHCSGCNSYTTFDHERVNAGCLADSRTEAGKRSLNE